MFFGLVSVFCLVEGRVDERMALNIARIRGVHLIVVNRFLIRAKFRATLSTLREPSGKGVT